MNTDEYIRDGKGHSYRVGALLGRGLYAKTYAVRGEDNKEWALKVPLNPSDLPKGSEKLAKISKQILQEQWRELSTTQTDDILLPKHQFTSQDGIYCLLYPRNDRSLYRELQRDCSLQELLAICIQISQILPRLPAELSSHGNIHPRNIFIGTNNSIQLADPVTATLEEYYQSFLEAKGQISGFVPPEIRSGEALHVRTSSTDSYCVAMLLYSSIMGQDSKTKLGDDGLNKLLRSNLQARLLSMLERDSSSNSRFRNRLATQLSRLLDRGLSPRYQPSPPFRFSDLRELTARLQDLHDLIAPSITHIGKIIFNRPPGSTLFETNENIDFSCSVETAPLLEDHQEIECGIMLFNRDKELERIRGLDCNYDVSRHPSGRLRFALMILNLPPSNYLLRLAFQIKGSVGEPYIIESTFEVLPAPGYVPPQREIPEKPLDISSRLPSTSEQTSSNEPEIPTPKDRPQKPVIVLPPHQEEEEEENEEEVSLEDNVIPIGPQSSSPKSVPKIVIKDPENLDAPMEYDSEFDTDYPSAEENPEPKEPPVVYNPPVQNIPPQIVEKTNEESPFEVSYEPIEEESEIEESIDYFEPESEDVEDSIIGILQSFIEKVRQDSILTVTAILAGVIILLLLLLFLLL